MFDDDTAARIRASPRFPSRQTDRLPEELTAASARIASARLQIRAARPSGSSAPIDEALGQTLRELQDLADAQEMFVATHPNRDERAAAAFVGATAHALLAQARRHLTPTPEGGPENATTTLDPMAVSSDIAAAVLFMAAGSVSDASQVADDIDPARCHASVRPLAVALKAFAKGAPKAVLAETIRVDRELQSAHDRAWIVAYRELLRGLQTFARALLGETDLSAATADALKRFEHVRRLTGTTDVEPGDADSFLSGALEGRAIGTYTGPHHLAVLLIAAVGDLGAAALVGVPPPFGVPPETWARDLARPAENRPFLWPNHKKAVESGYLDTGCSAVVSFPTGAGKSLIAELKIAAHRLRGSRVIVLAPTRALVEQTRRDLERRFRGASIDAVELPYIDDDDIGGEIIVATPEALLARTVLADDALDDVGLLVFDECHLLHPARGGWDRRAFDAMLCLLGFMRRAPEADVLLISAMLGNAEELAGWVAHTSGRDCLPLSIDFKPARQLRGVIVYDEAELHRVHVQLEHQRRSQTSPNHGVQAKRLAAATPRALVSLHLRWADVERADFVLLGLLDAPFQLNLNPRWELTPNANELAARLALSAAETEIKTLVFAPTVAFAASVAKHVVAGMARHDLVLGAEERRWFDEAILELGDPTCSYLSIDDEGRIDGRALVHHAKLLPAERRLVERLYRRSDGVRVLCATSTLAQGMNLPSELVILAGTKRSSANRKGQEDIEASELLNAAGRAGRAGETTNGVTLVIPSDVLSMEDDALPDDESWDTLQEVFGGSDRCIVVDDPFEALLDELESGLSDREADLALYALRRLRPPDDGGEPIPFEDLLRGSFAAYRARQHDQAQWVEERVQAAAAWLSDADANEAVTEAADIAAEMGLSRQAVDAVMQGMRDAETAAPTNAIEWVKWLFDVLEPHAESVLALARLSEATAYFGRGAAGEAGRREWTREAFRTLERVLLAWMSGATVQTLETLFAARKSADPKCERGRQFVLQVTRDLGYLAALPARLVAREIVPIGGDVARDSLDRCVRGGFNSIELLALAELDRSNEGRRRTVHEEYAALQPYLPDPSPVETFEDVQIRLQAAIMSRAIDQF